MEKTSDQVCVAEIDQFYKYFLFLHATSFVIEENSPAMHGWRKIVFLKLHLAPQISMKNFRLFVSVKNHYYSRFFQ